MYVGDIFTVFSPFGSCITHAVPLGLKANFSQQHLKQNKTVELDIESVASCSDLLSNIRIILHTKVGCSQTVLVLRLIKRRHFIFV